MKHFEQGQREGDVTRARKNYTLDADYKCEGCDARRVKLWRNYGYGTPLWCAMCCGAEQARKRAVDALRGENWDELHRNVPDYRTPLDFDGLDMVPAIPSEDPQFFQSAGAYKTDQLLWWHALPAFTDPVRELAALKITQLVTYRRLFHEQEKRREQYEKIADLEWRLDRQVMLVTRPFTLTLLVNERTSHEYEPGKWMTCTAPVEKLHSMVPGDRLAFRRRGGRAVVLLGPSWHDCPSICEYDDDSLEFPLDLLLAEDYGVLVDGRAA